jgi:hypothetical protein
MQVRKKVKEEKPQLVEVESYWPDDPSLKIITCNLMMGSIELH